jgi:hypothetical protein
VGEQAIQQGDLELNEPLYFFLFGFGESTNLV